MSEANLLAVEPLSRAAFAEFGDVLDTDSADKVFSINQGNTTRFHALAKVQCEGDGAHALISIFRAQPRSLPLPISMLERHPLGSQAFFPLSQLCYLVVVARDPQSKPRAFLAQPGQGVNYHRSTWHHPVLALTKVSDFLVIDRGGAGNNCDECQLPQTWQIAPFGLKPRRTPSLPGTTRPGLAQKAQGPR